MCRRFEIWHQANLEAPARCESGAYTRTFNKVKDNSASQFRTYQLFQEIYDKSRQRREEIRKLKIFSRTQEN
ncbi:MAG: hypothetical protein WCV67_02320 [Victivallaceae bacterium]